MVGDRSFKRNLFGRKEDDIKPSDGGLCVDGERHAKV